jgi:hypothetical protein
MEVLWNRMRCPELTQSSSVVDLSGCSSQTCHWCSFSLVSAWLNWRASSIRVTLQLCHNITLNIYHERSFCITFLWAMIPRPCCYIKHSASSVTSVGMACESCMLKRVFMCDITWKVRGRFKHTFQDVTVPSWRRFHSSYMNLRQEPNQNAACLLKRNRMKSIVGFKVPL